VQSYATSFDRRRLLKSVALPFLAAAQAAGLPLRIGHREASMKKVGNPDLFRLASEIPGLLGVEPQVVSGDWRLWEKENLLRYKREANRWGVQIPSLSGIWPRGASILKTDTAPEHIRRSIRAAEFLGSSVILVAFFRENCPDMSKESSYGPVVEMLKKVAPEAADAGVVLGLENSLNPAGNVQLIDLVGHPAVKIYYDLHNCEFYGHAGQAVPGIKLMGRNRIGQVHVKNEAKLIEEPGKIDWGAALDALKAIGYDGWYVFESQHSSDKQCIEATVKNIAFLRRHAI
jgi:L-ribulose-5-phosphate 3-epimerase